MAIMLGVAILLTLSTPLHAYVDPGSLGTVSQIIFVILNVALIFALTCFRHIKSLFNKLKRLFHK